MTRTHTFSDWANQAIPYRVRAAAQRGPGARFVASLRDQPTRGCLADLWQSQVCSRGRQRGHFQLEQLRPLHRLKAAEASSSAQVLR
jgi:hypothetical protein